MEPKDFSIAAREAFVEKYIVKLTEAERTHLQALISKGRSSAKRLLKARILLKADVSELGDAWSDGQIIKALDTNKSMVWRVRQQFVEEGLEAVLSRKQRAPRNNADFRRRDTGPADGAGLFHAARGPCSLERRLAGRDQVNVAALRLLEDKVVELGIVERASDSTIGRILKKTRCSLIARSSGSSRPTPMAHS